MGERNREPLTVNIHGCFTCIFLICLTSHLPSEGTTIPILLVRKTEAPRGEAACMRPHSYLGRPGWTGIQISCYHQTTLPLVKTKKGLQVLWGVTWSCPPQGSYLTVGGCSAFYPTSYLISPEPSHFPRVRKHCPGLWAQLKQDQNGMFRRLCN